MKGFAFLAVDGTPNIYSSPSARSLIKWVETYMCEDFLGQSPPLCVSKCLVETQYPSTPLQTVPSHFQLVHGMHILNMHFNTRPIGRLCGPEIKVLVPTGFEIESVIAVI